MTIHTFRQARQNRKQSLSTSILALALTGVIATTASAQDAPDEDVIVITGSRIPLDPNLTSPVPVQSLTSEEFRLSGEISLADVINDVPALVSSLTAENSVTGANALDLRGLGQNRTLTLVNGRRHVAGFEGSQAVDIGSIPQALVERVEVLTGGASAIYGADAVTGVVNFILKEDFEGLDLDIRGGISDQGDSENFSIRGVAGKNFAQGRGNVTLTVDYIEDSVLRFGDRDFSRDNRLADDNPNPALATDPNAFPRTILRDPRFSISSDLGLIAFQDFGPSGLDLNGNGTEDCEESSVGLNWLDFGFGGCHVIDANGTIRPFEDGLIARSTNQYGGDGVANTHNLDTLFPSVDTVTVNFNGRYDLKPNMTAFFEAKYSSSTASTFTELNGFFDLLPIAADNPFIPDILQATADNAGGLYVNRDPRDLVTGEFDTTERETVRFVGGVKGEFDNGWIYEVSGNYGEFNADFNDANFLILDRFFAAIDVVADPVTGQPVCRTDVDPTATPPGTPFGIPAFDEGIFTFRPGDGQCRPLNVLGGPFGASEEAVNFVTTSVTDSATIKQTVLTGLIAGDSEEYFSLPAGPIGFATGLEYRKEESRNRVNAFDRGIVPNGSPFPIGTAVSDVSNNQSLGFNGGASRTLNSGGEYDVFDVFGEVRVPLLADKPFVKDLAIDGAVRYADYSTSGGATTWKLGANWTVDDSLSFRGTLSQAIRAPNITELFSPEQPIFVRPDDPCDAAIIQTAPDPTVRAANCAAAGLPADFSDPLTARFAGTSGGNPNLEPETADTYTIGGVFRPSFVSGLSITVDYWNVKIDTAVGTLTAQDIVNGCFDTDLSNPLCDLFERNTDPTSPQFQGFTSIRTNTLNFAQSEADGIDFAGSYDFNIGQNDIGLRIVGTRQFALDNFLDPSDLTNVNPALGELQLPKWSGNATVSFARGPLTASLQGLYQSKQALRSVQIETADITYGPIGFSDEIYIFDANASYEWTENVSFYGGVNNLTGEDPFITETAFPVGPRGRFFFGGVRLTY